MCANPAILLFKAKKLKFPYKLSPCAPHRPRIHSIRTSSQYVRLAAGITKPPCGSAPFGYGAYAFQIYMEPQRPLASALIPRDSSKFTSSGSQLGCPRLADRRAYAHETTSTGAKTQFMRACAGSGSHQIMLSSLRLNHCSNAFKQARTGPGQIIRLNVARHCIAPIPERILGVGLHHS